jgi:hypothetical protein
MGGDAQREQQFSDADWGQSSRRDPARDRVADHKINLAQGE